MSALIAWTRESHQPQPTVHLWCNWRFQNYIFFIFFIYLFFLDSLYGDRTVTYFSLDTDEDRKDEQLFNPKQKVYSECVEDAVKDLLVSPEIDAQLKDCPIEIVDVSNFFFCFD